MIFATFFCCYGMKEPENCALESIQGELLGVIAVCSPGFRF